MMMTILPECGVGLMLPISSCRYCSLQVYSLKSFSQTLSLCVVCTTCYGVFLSLFLFLSLSPFLPLSPPSPPSFSLLSLPLLYSTLERKSRRLIAQDGWSPPSFDSSCVRLVLYQDHEGRGKKQIFDTKAHLASLSSQDTPETNVRKLAY